MTDYDSPWKEALDFYFEPFMEFFFPGAYADIDWTHGYESLDKELQKIVPEGELGRRHVDKLAKVWLRDGHEQWVLIHIEVQADEDAEFGERMFVYSYRLYDRYNRREVVSIAVLADDNPRWRPDSFGYARWGFETGIRFPIVKLLDYVERVEWLESHANPFAIVVLAHLKTLETRRDDEGRYTWKVRLVKGLYDRGMSAENIRRLFRFIDWIMALPRDLNVAFSDEAHEYAKEKHMPYIITPVRLAMEKALCKGIEAMLDIRFGEEGLQLMPELHELDDVELLESILKAAKTAASPDELRRMWTKQVH